MKLQRNLHRRLEEVRAEANRLRDTLRILDEQVAYQASVTDDAELRAVVAQTPLADRDHHAAGEDLRRLKRQRDETAGRLAELNQEQDALLDRLLEQSG